MEIFNDFTLGVIIGYVIGMICSFIVETLCIATGKSDINTWVEEDTPLEPPNKPIDED
jgi:hypothetical protein